MVNAYFLVDKELLTEIMKRNLDYGNRKNPSEMTPDSNSRERAGVIDRVAILKLPA